MSDAIITAPWSEDQVAALNAFQVSGVAHPFTCEGEHQQHQTLIAELDGWHCPDPDCSFTQDWALSVMADREMVERVKENRVKVWGRAAYVSKDPALSELERVREELRATQDQLAEARGRIGTLTQQNRAMRIVLSRVTQAQKAGLSPSVEATAGDCDAVFILGDTGGRAIETHELPDEDGVDNCE